MKKNTELTRTPATVSLPSSANIPPPTAAVWMLKKSICLTDQETELAKFKTAYEAELIRTGCRTEASAWAYRFAWERMMARHKPIVEFTMYVMTIFGVVLGLLALALT